MQKKYKIIGAIIIIILGFGMYVAKIFNAQKIQKLPNASYSLEDVIDGKKSPSFACSFGRFTVEMVPSQYRGYKYFKVSGVGILINSGFLHTKVGSNPQIIYAVPKDAPLSNGAVLSTYCIANLSKVPYEGNERKDIDQSAEVVQFYLLEQ